MKHERFQQIDRLLDEVLDCPTRERPALLERKCGDDFELRRRVESLVASLDQPEDFIETPPFSSVKKLLDHAEAEDLSGANVGAYLLTELLGRGGMGAVYRAQRTNDFEKEVAVKIISPLENRLDSAENFRRERQILARLEHPNIARLLDGGTTKDGSPFLVMELVEGLPLDRFCRENKLSLKQKLKLFQEICRAVTFAHQNLVVHLDLKPNNILVTKDGTPKLLDFGIAGLLDANAAHHREKNSAGSALTLEYAAPEQFAGENVNVAADVYSLGVILYEMLAGSRPFDFAGKNFHEIRAVVQTESPPAPTTFSVSKNRFSDGELDSIVLKSLAKSPPERYQTTNDFCSDVENYLKNLPVAARPPNFFYRARKFIGRHQYETAAAAIFAVVLIGWLATAIFQARATAVQARDNRRAAYSAEMILAAGEYENANLNRLRELLEKYQPNADDAAEDLRGFEWYFLNNLLNPSSKIAAFRHPDEVWSAEFSPDGKSIVTACNDNFVRIWNVETGAMIQTNHQRGAWKISFFPDGKLFAAASSSNQNPVVVIYETATGAEVLTLKGHTKRIRAVDVAPDGKTIATGSQDGTIRIWNAASGAELKQIAFGTPSKNVEFYDLQFSKNGDKLAALGFETLVVFDTRTWTNKSADAGKFADKNFLLTGWKVVFSPLEKTLAVGSFEGDVAFVDAETLEIRRVMNVHRSNVKSLAFSADGKTLVTGSGDRTVKFIDVPTGEILNELRGHFSGVHEVVFSPDNSKIATASADFNLNVWNAAEVADQNAILTGAANFAFDSAGEKAFGWNGVSEEFVAWNLTGKRRIYAAKSDAASVLAMAYSDAKNRVALGGRDGQIRLLDASGSTKSKMFHAAERAVYKLVFTPDGKRLCGSFEDGAIRCFDAETGAEIFVVRAFGDIVKALAISPDGKFLAAGGNDKIVKIFDAATGAELAVLSGNSKPIYEIAFSANGAFIASAGADDTARIWRISDRKLVHELTGMSAGVFALAFAPDGKRLATASDVGVIRLWNFETGEQVLAFTASRRQITHLKFTADGKTLLSADASRKIQFWQGKF